MKARFAGTCRRCGEPIAVNEVIELRDGVWAHPACEMRVVVEHESRSAKQVTIVEPGVYEKDGVVYFVKPTQDGKRLYANQLVEFGGTRLTEAGETVGYHPVYAPGAVYQLTPEHKMLFERAKELSLRYGRCINCGKKLSAAKSVEAGIGPVCAKRFARPRGEVA